MGKPSTLDNIERIASADGVELVRDRMRSHTPVVITDLQRGTGMASITSEQGVIDALGDVVIQVQQNYTSPLSTDPKATRSGGLSQKVRNPIEEMPLRDYLDHVRRNPRTDLLCVEYRTPDAVLDRLRVPDLCRAASGEPLVTFMFVANQGNYAHLHFDGDFRNVLLYQVFGRKRVVMVPLSAQDRIAPSMNFSKLLLQNLGTEEKLHLFRYLGAYDTILRPGETILFPPSIWHYVEYLDTGMSVNFRFGRDPFAARLVDANRVPFYPELHELLDRLVRMEDGAARVELENAVWARAVAVLGREYRDSPARHAAVQELYRDLLDELPGPPARPAQVSVDCPIAESMAVERYDSPSRRWRDELMLGAPL